MKDIYRVSPTCEWLLNWILQDPGELHHVIKMTYHFYIQNHLCITMEFLSINLYELIVNRFIGFSMTLIKQCTSQILMLLLLMRQHQVGAVVLVNDERVSGGGQEQSDELLEKLASGKVGGKRSAKIKCWMRIVSQISGFG